MDEERDLVVFEDDDGNELTLAPGEVFSEEEDTAAPTFDYLVDGIIVLS